MDSSPCTAHRYINTWGLKWIPHFWICPENDLVFLSQVLSMCCFGWIFVAIFYRSSYFNLKSFWSAIERRLLLGSINEPETTLGVVTLKILSCLGKNHGNQQWHPVGFKDITHRYTVYFCHGRQRNKIKKQEAASPILVHDPARGLERMIYSFLHYTDFAWTIVAGLLAPTIVSVHHSDMQK